MNVTFNKCTNYEFRAEISRAITGTNPRQRYQCGASEIPDRATIEIRPGKEAAHETGEGKEHPHD